MDILRSVTLRRSATTVAAILVTWLFLWPVLWMLTSSVRPENQIFAYLNPLSVFSVLPKSLTLENFRLAFQSGVGRAVLNSIIVAAATTIFGLLLSVPAAFALAVLRFPFRRTAFVILFVSFSVPFDLVAIPLSSVFRNWHLANTYPGLILPGLASGFAILLLRQFFANIPPELCEAARVDGASWMRIMVQLYTPLARPALIGAGLLLFIFQWQSFLWPLLIADNPNMQLGPVALASLQASGVTSTEFGAIFAGATILTVIPAILLLVFQRSFVETLATTGSKG
jgi:ABC-type glycerol-3-phosphate transport system permease component